jgi:hypothetical protein
MKTMRNIGVSAYVLTGMFSLLFVPVLYGDTWMLPSGVNISSPSGNYIAQVSPGSGGYGGYERAITNREHNASVILMRSQEGVTNVVWKGKLINPAAPVDVYVSDSGYMVTMDNWHNIGYGPIIVIYDPQGRLVRYWSLEELFKPEESLRLPRSVSSIRWHAGSANFGAGSETNIFVVPAVGKSFRFDLRNVSLLASSNTVTNAESGAPNLRH